MTSATTTIRRVSTDQRSRLSDLAAQRSSLMTETLDAALQALRRDHFYRAMADAESAAPADADSWHRYISERDPAQR